MTFLFHRACRPLYRARCRPVPTKPQAALVLKNTTLPRVRPIIPTWRKEPFDDPDWLFDFKYDGFRAICYLEHRRNRLISRNNNVMTRFEALAGQVAAALNIDEAILDGEIIAADETGRPFS